MFNRSTKDIDWNAGKRPAVIICAIFQPTMSEETKTESGVVWAAIGKLAVIVAVVGGGIGIFSYFFPHSPVLEAHVAEETFLLPPDAVQKLKDVTSRHFYDVLAKDV